MAQRWSFSEDYIIAKFCQEHRYLRVDGNLLDELILRLHQNGFSSRSENAVNKRAKDFVYLFRGCDSSNATKQVKEIYGILSNEGYRAHQENLKAFIAEKQQMYDEQFDGHLSTDPNSLSHMVHIAKGPKFIDVLEDYIQKSGIKPKSKIYSSIGISDDTFSAIRRGKYKSVSREHVFRICFGLRLRYDDAVTLVNSAGYFFREYEILDIVVEYHLRRGPTYDSVDKYRGKETLCYIYDTQMIDTDLLDSGEKALFSLD